MATDVCNSIRSLSSELNRTTDEALEMVQAVEEFLTQECSIGIHVFVAVPDLDEPGATEQHYLEYRRINSKYRIAVVRSDTEGNDLYIKPWFECTRRVKFESVKKVPDLLEEIAKRLHDMVQQSTTTTKEVKKALKALIG